MSTNEDMPVIPATEGEQYISKAGIYLLQPVRVAVWKDANGIPRKDKTGNPGLLITFKDVTPNKKGEFTGALSSTGFYYSDLPMGDPRRQDESLKCKSEFQLGNLKTAMGFPQNLTVQPKDFLERKVWAPVKEVQFYTPEGEYVKSSYDIIKKFNPYIPGSDSLGKPSIIGDPAQHPDGKPEHDFIEIRTDYQQASAPAAEKKFKPTVVDDEEVGGTTDEERPTLSSEKREEPPDY